MGVSAYDRISGVRKNVAFELRLQPIAVVQTTSQQASHPGNTAPGINVAYWGSANAAPFTCEHC